MGVDRKTAHRNRLYTELKKLTEDEFQQWYGDESDCLNVLTSYKKGQPCVQCRARAPHYNYFVNREAWRCSMCHYQNYYGTGTPFFKKKSAIQPWFYAYYLWLKAPLDQAKTTADQKIRKMTVKKLMAKVKISRYLAKEMLTSFQADSVSFWQKLPMNKDHREAELQARQQRKRDSNSNRSETEEDPDKDDGTCLENHFPVRVCRIEDIPDLSC